MHTSLSDGNLCEFQQTPKIQPAPLLGQHNADILREWLGLDAIDIETFRQDDVI
jgi:crotonobetainyl-CoA:carnitine CoA-transferase CaiB-like acyl-CoA transferase